MMKIKKILIIVALFTFMIPSPVGAQKILTLDDLMRAGKSYKKVESPRLKDNQTTEQPDIKISKEQNNLFFVDKHGNKNQITTDGSREIVYGESVHRNEFGIDGGIFWSPDSQKVAFYRMDQSMVDDYPQVDMNMRIATMMPDKYPMAGETSHKVTIGIYDVKSNKVAYLDLGNPKDRYFTNITWGPEGKRLFLIELNRDQTDASLDCYDTETGRKIASLYKEHNDKYVEPLHPIKFLPWNNNQFLLQSQRDGYNNLYLYEFTDENWEKQQNIKLVRSLFANDMITTDVYGFNINKKILIIQAVKSDSKDYNIYSVNLTNGKWKMLSNGIGYHTAFLNKSGNQLYDKYSAPDCPLQVDITNTATGKTKPYFTAKNPWEGYFQPIFRSGTIKSADNKTDLFYRMVLPHDFDESKKYPTIVYVYGGPHARNVTNAWNYAYRPWEVYMAEKGYIIFILDNRGSSDRGREFEQATFRQLGQEEMKDQMKGVDFLKSLPYVDSTKLGVHGWSFGGFMTISLMLNYPDIFKVGIAGGPVIDWKYYEVMYGERYMDTPQSNPEGYEKTSLLNKVNRLNGKLLIIHGANDNTVVPQHSMQFLKAAIDADKPIDFFMYPEEEHNMRGRRSIHLHEKITQYFLDYLK